MPSGSFRPSLARVFKSEPSGFTESTRPPPKSRKNNRPEVGPESAFACFDPETPERPVIVLLIAHLPGLRPLDKRAGWRHSNADCQFQVFAATFDWYDDVVRQYLRVSDDLSGG